jgi:O-antigen ligase
MAGGTKEGTEMKRKKRFTIKLVALGFAIAALAAPSAQAYLDPSGTGRTQIVTPQDRPIHGVGYSSYSTQPNVVLGADDRAFDRMSPTTREAPVLTSSDDGFELGSLGMTGIVLALMAGAALIAVYEARKHKLIGA